MNSTEINNGLNRADIISKAEIYWNSKSDEDKEKSGNKYQHFLYKYNIPTNDWRNNFDGLTKHQQNVVVKGQLIRWYDSLPNIDKTRLMRNFGLSTFSSKWYKLPGIDKKRLLNYIIR